MQGAEAQETLHSILASHLVPMLRVYDLPAMLHSSSRLRRLVTEGAGKVFALTKGSHRQPDALILACTLAGKAWHQAAAGADLPAVYTAAVLSALPGCGRSLTLREHAQTCAGVLTRRPQLDNSYEGNYITLGGPKLGSKACVIPGHSYHIDLLLNARTLSLSGPYDQPTMTFSPSGELLACRPGKQLHARLALVRAPSETSHLTCCPGFCGEAAPFLLIDAHTGRKRKVKLPGGEPASLMTWAPDGTAVAVQTESGFVILCPSGQLLASATVSFDLSDPTPHLWQPDSRAFCCLPHAGGLFTMDAGTGATQLHRPSTREYMAVAWLPCERQCRLWLAIVYRCMPTELEMGRVLIGLQAAERVGSALPKKFAVELEVGYCNHLVAGASNIAICWSAPDRSHQNIQVFAIGTMGPNATLFRSHVLPLAIAPHTFVMSPDSLFVAYDAPLGMRTSQGVLCGVKAVHLGSGKLVSLPIFSLFRQTIRPACHPVGEMQFSRDGSRLAVSVVEEKLETCWQQVYTFAMHRL